MAQAAQAPVKIDLIDRACPLCNEDNVAAPASKYSYKEWTVKNCANCNFVYIDQAPDYRHLFEELDWDTTFAAEIERRKEIRPISYSVSKMTRARMRILPRQTIAAYLFSHFDGGNIVDLGCGSGGQIIELADRFTPFGIEVSKKLAAQANELFSQYGGRVVCAPCTEGLKSFPDGFFTAASLRSYLEHEMQPKQVLQELHRALKPGGIAIVKVPNYGSLNRRVMGSKWCGFRYPDHLNYFTPASLKKMAEESGFTCKFTNIGRLPTSDNMWATLIRKPAA